MLRRIADEVFSAGFLGRARLRARRRKSPWNLVLIPLFLGGAGAAGCAFFTLVWHVHTWIYPAHSGRLRDFWPRGLGFPAFASSFLLAVPPCIAAIPVGMILANLVAWCIPPARRAFRREAEGIPWASFGESMAGLAWISTLLVPIGLALGLVGAATLRSLK